MSKLINISDASSIAIHSLVLIANSKEQINSTKIADQLGFSRNHLAKVLQLLVKHNFLGSGRGPKGGFTLRKDPKKVSILEIYELVEGKIDTCSCIHGIENCPFNECVYGDFRTRFNIEFKEYFGKRNLSDIILKSKKEIKTKKNKGGFF